MFAFAGFGAQLLGIAAWRQARGGHAPLMLFWLGLALLVASPRRYFGSLALAVATAAPGFRGLLFQCFYFLEAVVVGRYLRRHRIDHLHNHFADSS